MAMTEDYSRVFNLVLMDLIFDHLKLTILWSQKLIRIYVSIAFLLRSYVRASQVSLPNILILKMDYH